MGFTSKMTFLQGNKFKNSKNPFFTPSLIQRKLMINEPDDVYEQEADIVADKVMRMPDHSNSHSFTKVNISSLHRKSTSSEEEVKMQLKESCKSNSGIVAPPIVSQVLSGSGKPLDKNTLQFMETRMGQDFSKVHIHTDAKAAESAQSVNALAYTSGNHIVFNSGQYVPNTDKGRRLLAHELVHVGQQGYNKMIQRQPDPAPKSATAKSGNNIVVSLDNDAETKIQSKSRIKGAKQIRAYSVSDLVAKLSKMSGNIDNIIIYSHGTVDGSVKFVDASSKTTWVTLEELTNALSGKIKIKVENIEFEGCSLGNATKELQEFGKSLNAKGVKAHTCFTFNRILTKITINGKTIKKKTDIKKGDEVLFRTILLEQVQKQLVASNGISVTDCVENITKGMVDISELEKSFFDNNGKIQSNWDSPIYNEDWQKDSLCKKDVTASTSPCKLEIVSP